MIDYLVQNLWTFWAVLAMVCLVLELSSGDFYITCFGIGAVCARLSPPCSLCRFGHRW